MRYGGENEGGGGGRGEEEVERRPYLNPRKEPSVLKSILRQGHVETAEKAI